MRNMSACSVTNKYEALLILPKEECSAKKTIILMPFFFLTKNLDNLIDMF